MARLAGIPKPFTFNMHTLESEIRRLARDHAAMRWDMGSWGVRDRYTDRDTYLQDCENECVTEATKRIVADLIDE